MTPNAEFYKPTTEYADKLISQIGQTPSWIAKRIGVTDKRIRYILDGERTVKGETTPIQMTYTEQFALECLADVSEDSVGFELLVLEDVVVGEVGQGDAEKALPGGVDGLNSAVGMEGLDAEGGLGDELLPVGVGPVDVVVLRDFPGDEGARALRLVRDFPVRVGGDWWHVRVRPT